MYIDFIDYTKTLKGTDVLKNISIHFEGGKVYGLKGKNGSGKTMLMRAVTGLIRATGGSVCINGETLGRDISFPRSIGVLIEHPAFLSGYTGYKNLSMLASIQKRADDSQIRACMKRVGLNPDDRRKYRKYSLGMKQRLGIACAVMEDPDIILLDEPFNAIDEKGTALVKSLLYELRDAGKLIILTCHDKEELESLSDEVIHIEEGEIVCK